MMAADFGCGAGGWTIPLAEMLEDGLVIAIDVQEAPLSALMGRARLQGLSNIRKINADVEGRIRGLADLSCDFVLMTDLLFQVEQREAVFQEARRVLKKEGKILVVEWNVDSPLGPRQGRISQEEIKQIAEKVGFQLETEFPAGDYHFALIFVKK